MAEQRTPVSALREGDAVDEVFACSRKERRTARTGTTYLALELRDRSGTIAARAFRDADVIGGRFQRGDLVRVRGRVERFRDELQVDVRDARPAGEGLDPADFVPVAYRDLDELDGFLEHLAREVHDPGLRALLAAFLDDAELRRALRGAPCTRGGHHAYLGGLLEHTVAVATLALEATTLHPRLDSDLLLCAAILHDVGKVRELTWGADIELTEEGALIGHVAIGHDMIRARAAGVEGLDPARVDALAHCVLGHHGPEGLPGRRYRLPEALCLARVNALDAQVKGALEHGLGPAPQ